MDFQEKKDKALRKKQVKKAAIASIVGTSIEWYDFFSIWNYGSVSFSKAIFPRI